MTAAAHSIWKCRSPLEYSIPQPEAGKRVKLCYCDESGTGEEPIATMVGVYVDAMRMHLMKEEWAHLLAELSRRTGRAIVEIHAVDFYAGNGVWRGISGPERAEIITRIFNWLRERKHKVVYTSVVKAAYQRSQAAGKLPDELNTHWRFLGLHLVLAIQKYSQKQTNNKGHTIFVFDNQHIEETRFSDLLLRPPAWSDGYYARRSKQQQLDQLVDVPYFADSKHVGLIQVADVIAFFVRRFAELQEGVGRPEAYKEERERLAGWMCLLGDVSIGTGHIYPKRDRDFAAELFYEHAPASIRSL